MFSIDVPLAFAFGAGIAAAFNPCGAAMFPAYVGYQLDTVGSEGRTPIRSALQAAISRETVADTIAVFVYGIVIGLVATAVFLGMSLVGQLVARAIRAILTSAELDLAALESLTRLLPYALVVGTTIAVGAIVALVVSERKLEIMKRLDKTIAESAYGIMLGLAATAGFVVVFGSVGLILAAGGRVVGKFLPFAGLGVGVIIAGAGLYLLLSKSKLGIMAASRVDLGQGKGLRQVFLFGIAYAIASLSCALPIFLAAIGFVAGQSLSAGGILEPIVGSISYGLGMGAMLVLATLGVVLFKDLVQRGFRAIFPYIEPVGNVAMVVAGLYLVYYWAFGSGSELLALRVEELF